MLPYTQEEIICYLDKWFEINKDKKNMFSSDQIGKLLKRKLSTLGYWKDKRNKDKFSEDDLPEDFDNN